MDTAVATSENVEEEVTSTPVVAEEKQEELSDPEETTTSPDSEEEETSETKELTLEDPEVKELLKGERARLEESYRRKEENALTKARSDEYDRARERAYNTRVQDQYSKVETMMKKASDEGEEPDLKALESIMAETSANGLIEAGDGLEGWLNSFLQEDNKDFYTKVPEALNTAWISAKQSNRPDLQIAAALKIAAASGEARGYAAGEKSVAEALKTRTKAKEKTQKTREASAANAAEGQSAAGISGNSVPKLTVQQIDDMPMRDWMAIPKEERDKTLEAAWKQQDAVAKKG